MDGAELRISGYVLFRKDRSSTVERRGGGVLLFVREVLSPVEFNPLTEYPEHVWCRLGDVGRRGLLLGICYRTASHVFGYDINARLRELGVVGRLPELLVGYLVGYGSCWSATELLVELKDDRILLMGDFNYPGVDWTSGECKGESQEGIMFVECSEDNFYEQYVKRAHKGGGGQYPGSGYYK